jgi:hypothetical protein
LADNNSVNVKIFVSYSRRDASDFAEKISETLEDESSNALKKNNVIDRDKKH